MGLYTKGGVKIMNEMNEKKVIKRYQNRKLYDTYQSCYVTLAEISQMIKNGDDLCVIDNKTKNNITQVTLTQLLYESERRNSNPIPVELLKKIISDGDGSFSGYIRKNFAPEMARYETTEKVPHTSMPTKEAPSAVSETPVTQ